MTCEAVGDDPADERQQQNRQLAEEVVEPQIKGRLRELEDEPRLRNLLHPVADGRGEGAEPEDAKVAVFERGEGAIEQTLSF
jgi:hypothetical protein